MSNEPHNERTEPDHGSTKQVEESNEEYVTISHADEVLDGLSPLNASQVHVEGADEDGSSRYELSKEIARGGMGAVHRGHDRRLGRDLAIKVLLSSHSESPAALQRFVEEAQIGGQLQHPGIVPVYDMGKLPDGLPFLAMKLVKGETLASLLKNRADVEEDRNRFLGIFEQVCQTLAYAHAKSVVHRDLKPANIMVGMFGEVQVMDWGLAKVVSGEVSDDESVADKAAENKTVIQTIRSIGDESSSGSGSHTQSGSVLGTIAYMPPEQAMGQVESIDARADVFGLGSILCHILTGKPPYVAEDRAKLHRMAIRCDLKQCYERLNQCPCDEELKQIVRSCLAEEPSERFQDAGEIAKQLARYLQSVDDRLRNSELEKAASHAREVEALNTAASERKRRRMTTVLAVVSSVFLVACGLAAVWVQNNRRQLAEANSAAERNEFLRAQEAEQRKQQQIRELEGELGIAQEVLTKAQDLEPTSREMQRALSAIERCEVLIESSAQSESGEQSSDILKRFRAVKDGHARLMRTIRWLDDLDSVRSRAMQATLQREYGSFHSSETGITEVLQNPLPVDQIEASFLRWGINLEDSGAQIASEIGSLPGWARSSVIIATRLWRDALQEQPRFERLKLGEWTPLRPSKTDSRKGATLTVLEDLSILASGDNPNCDVYELQFPLDSREFEVLRIEALPHKSQPRGGLGRGGNGEACMSDLQLSVVDLEEQKEYPLTITCAEADFCFEAEPLERTHWNLTLAGAVPRVAMFYVDLPEELDLTSPSSKLLKVILSNHSVEEWGDQNFGRIRVAIDEPESALRVMRVVDKLAAVIEQFPLNSWQESVWQAREAQDINGLLELADDPATSKQSDADLILLAETLNQLGERHYVDRYLNEAKWQRFPPGRISANDTDLEVQKDGSILATRWENNHDSYWIDWPDFGTAQGPPKAIRIETMDPPGELGPGLSSGPEGCLIGDIRVVMSRLDQAILQTQKIKRISADHRVIVSGRPFLAADSDRSTFWKIEHPAGRENCSAIIELDLAEDFEFGGRFYLYIYTGQWIGRTESSLRHFRISWTFDEPDIVDAQTRAMDLLRSAYIEQPDNDRLMLAMARQILIQSKPDFQEAIGYTTAAIALRPDDPATLQSFARLVLMQQPSPRDPLYRKAIGLMERTETMADDAITSIEIADYWMQVGDKHFSGNDYDKAAEAYFEAYQVSPEEFVGFDRIAFCFSDVGKEKQAEEFFQLGLAKEPENPWCYTHYGSLLAKRGEYEKALQMFERGTELLPDDSYAYSSKANLLTYLKRWEEAASAYEAYQRAGGKSYYTLQQAALVLVELGREQDALDLLELQWQEGGRGGGICDLLLLTRRLQGDESTALRLKAAIEEEEKTLGLLDRGLRYSTMQNGGVHKFPFPPNSEWQGYRVYEFEDLEFVAELLVESEPDNGSYQRALMLVQVALDNYEAAAESATKILELTERFVGIERFVIAVAEQQRGNQAKAVSLYREATERANDIRGGYTLGMLDWIRERPEVQQLGQLAEQSPQ